MTATLTRPTLILNKNWQAIDVAPVADALKKVWADNAKVVDPNDYCQYAWDDWSKLKPDEDELFIQCVGFKLRVPEVITLANYSKFPQTTLSFSRRNLFQRDEETCQYCGIKPGLRNLTIDHILPRSRGGLTSWDNCAAACIKCNHRKAAKTLKESGMRLRKEPIRPKWRPTFHSGIALDSWEKFVSEMYWNVPLEE